MHGSLHRAVSCALVTSASGNALKFCHILSSSTAHDCRRVSANVRVVQVVTRCYPRIVCQTRGPRKHHTSSHGEPKLQASVRQLSQSGPEDSHQADHIKIISIDDQRIVSGPKASFGKPWKLQALLFRSSPTRVSCHLATAVTNSAKQK